MVRRLQSASSEPVILETRVVRGSGGGPDKTILNSPRHLESAGYRTVCAYMHPPGDPGFEQLRAKADAARVPMLSVHDRGPWDWRVVSDYLTICRRERVSIWHGHDYKSNALGLLLHRFWPMRLVTTIHGWVTHTRRTPLYYAIDRFCLPRYESVICVSPDLYAQALQHGVSRRRSLLVENAIDTEEFARRTEIATAKRREGLSPERIVVGAMGRLSGEKGFDLLLRAMAGIDRNRADFDLVIVGEGEAERDLRTLIAELGLGDRVRLLGYRTDTRGIFEAMDVFALSSLREGLPNVVLEAMAMEVPVIATRVGGLPRLIRDGMNGVLIEPGSTDALAAALSDVVRNPALRNRLALAGRQTVVERYSFVSRMQKIRAVYDTLLSRN